MQFDVATIHTATMPSAVELANSLRAGTLKLGQQVQGNQASFNLMSLRDLLVVAYGVKPTQVSGPAWLTQQRYNITALMPDGVDPKRMPEMLQALLKERFNLVAHKDPVEQQVYALTVARGGHKMKEATPPPPVTEAEPTGKGGTVVSVDSEGQLPIQLDGEQPGTTSVRFEVVPRAIRLRVPA